MASQLAFYFDASACIGCKTCQIACIDRSDLPAGMKWRRVLEYTGGDWIQDPDSNVLVPSNVFAYYVSTACMHCANPTCLPVCPTTAITKRDDGVVLINQDLCIGCRYCEWACPYGAPVFNPETNKMSKCDFCYDLVAAGEDPACVASCPLRCLDFGELTELRSKYGRLAAIEPLPSAEYTDPAVVITPHKDAQRSGFGTGYIGNVEGLENEPR
jgi:anaerobic dimethyl sulfoxide reductase subunit B (iron-sulfur subunit)